MNENSMSRRGFLRGAAMTAVAALAASCAQPTPMIIEKEVPVEKIVRETVVVEKQVAVEKVVKETVIVEKSVPVERLVTATPIPERFHEAPMLADLVAAGKLPPVDERLPVRPLVLGNMDGTIGKYGGTLRRGMTNLSDSAGPSNVTGMRLVFFNPDLTVREEAAQSWEASADGSTWTFHLREGMRWSDGEPFTSKDFVWWWENNILNTTLQPSVPSRWKTTNGVMELEAPDDFTVVLKFADAYTLFILQAAQDSPWDPGHYLQQFHMDLTSDKAALEKATKDAGFDTWDQYFANRNTWYVNPDLPTVGAWLAENSMDNELFMMTRNPYFWWVDPEGNQLPYLDRVQHRRFSTGDVFNMWVVNGEVDYTQRHISLGDYTLYKENETKGDYRVRYGADDGTIVLAMNMTCPNEKNSEFFQNRDVRIAISHAIDRVTINDLVFDGMGIPRQYSPPSGSPQYYAELTNAYLEYDTVLANKILDDAGYQARGADGIRLYPGTQEPITMIIEIMEGGDISDVTEMLVKYLGDIGINAIGKLLERGLLEEHIAANTLESTVAKNSRAILPLIDPSFFLDIAGNKLFGIAWRHYYRSPKNATAAPPPEGHWLWTMWDLWDQINRTPDIDQQNSLFRQILDITLQELPVVGIVGEQPLPIIVKNGFHAFAEGYVMPLSNPTKHGYLVPVCTYYWDEPEKHS